MVSLAVLARRCRRWLFADLPETETRRADREAFYRLQDRILLFGYRDREFRFFLPDGDRDAMQVEIIRRRTFFEDAILRDIRARIDLAGGLVVDAGASIGNHAVYFSGVCGAARIVAFEPDRYAAGILARNIELNRLDNVELRREILADARGLSSIDPMDPRRPGRASSRLGGEDLVATMPLDDLRLDRLDLLKCDVENRAALVMSGARRTLEHFRPPVLIRLASAEIAAVGAFLAGLGYELATQYGSRSYLFAVPSSRASHPLDAAFRPHRV